MRIVVLGDVMLDVLREFMPAADAQRLRPSMFRKPWLPRA